MSYWNAKTIQLYERRIDNALTARDRCALDSWGYEYWGRVVAILLRKLNLGINKEERE